jgi:hypothetical protein
MLSQNALRAKVLQAYDLHHQKADTSIIDSSNSAAKATGLSLNPAP